jgi:hypothetical protein
MDQLHDTTRRGLALFNMFSVFGFDPAQVDVDLALPCEGAPFAYLIVTVHLGASAEPTCCALAGPISEARWKLDRPVLNATWFALSREEQDREVSRWVPSWEAVHFARLLIERGAQLNASAMALMSIASALETRSVA